MTGANRDWPHAPSHRLSEAGTYMITAGTYQKVHLLNSERKLSLFCDILFSTADELGWQLQAWAALGNHYHFVALSPDRAPTLRRLISKLHTLTAIQLNRFDETPGRRVWYQYWDTHITYERSFLARLNYVHQNAVHHGVVPVATSYKWCSAAWFERNATPAFQKTLADFGMDRLNVADDF